MELAELNQLLSLGTVLSLEDARGRRPPRAFGVDALCEKLQAIVTGSGPRAAVLLGEPGVGKTAVVYEVNHRLRNTWFIRLTPQQFLTGTKYLGEWETRLQTIVDTARRHNVVLYIPNLEQLSEIGRTSKTDANVASALAPYIEQGAIAIVGESTPDAFRTGLGAIPSLRRLFQVVEMHPANPRDVDTIVAAVCREAGAELPDPVREKLTELADSYLPGVAQPGRTVGLLRRVLAEHADGPITQRQILKTLSISTGIPVDLLDDEVPLDRRAVRDFFEARVMGQPEAVDAVVELITLVKAGLTDPGKPFGVFLFVGPTGVGKTELARALAEFLFGDPARVVRFDLSEFASYDAYQRLIGTPGTPGLLTSRVSEQPFSVLLLDELEKGHVNIFDLCLQMFDAGRLTDFSGRTVDLRRTIIVLTSNVGAAVPAARGMGFGAGPTAGLDREVLLRELARFFRPEFLNRLDRIVTFRPLSPDTAEHIARREVTRVLQRSGLARRHLSVDIDPSLLTLLLREGYSAAFGARPLKRTVERLVLLPLAEVIVAGRIPAGSTLRLETRHGRVHVRVVTTGDSGRPDSRRLLKPPPRSASIAEWVAALGQELARLRHEAEPLALQKTELLGRLSQPEFWADQAAAKRTLDEIHRLDATSAALDAVARALDEEITYVHAHRMSTPDLARAEARLEELESRLQHVAFLIVCRDPRDLGDAVMVVTLVSSRGTGLDAVGRLTRMYLGLADRNDLKTDILDDREQKTPAEDTVAVVVSGAGAYALLGGERGLHQFSRGGIGDQGRRPTDRDLVRVEVLPLTHADPIPSHDVQVESRALDGRRGRVIRKRRLEVRLLHRPSMTAVRAWMDATQDHALERLQPLLRARIDAATGREDDHDGAAGIVRRYTLGPAPLVRDLRTGRTTGRLDDVLSGQLERFLISPRVESSSS